MYFILEPAVGTKETGHVFPAVESYGDYDFNAVNSVHKLKSREFPDFEPDLRFKLAKGAKLCDMMGQATISAHGFLVSERLKSIFEKVSIIPHKYYPAMIEAKEGLHTYYWMQLVSTSEFNMVSYKDSDFFIKKFSKNLGVLQIESEEDFQKKRAEIGVTNTVGFNFIYIRGADVDLFSLPFFSDIYISKNLKSQLDNSKLTGLRISEADRIKSL